jgi:hypothetical protein
MSLLTSYEPLLRIWDKRAGPKPRSAEFREAIAAGCHKGALDTFAVAMAFRKHGATQLEIRLALGDEHRNKIAELVTKRVVHRVAYPPRNTYTVYKIILRGPQRPDRQLGNEQRVAA